MENTPIDWGSVNASRQLTEKIIEFTKYRTELFSKEVEYSKWLGNALTFIANNDAYHMRLVTFLMKELATTLGISFEEVAVRVYSHDIKEMTDYTVNFNPNTEEEYTVLTLVPAPVEPEQEESDDET